MTKLNDLLAMFSAPVAEIILQNEKIYLFSLGTSDISAFKKLEKLKTSTEKLRSFLPLIASKSIPIEPEYEHLALDSNFVDKLTDDDLEVLAKEYLASSYISNLSVGKVKLDLPRSDAESAIAYLIRLLSDYVNKHNNQLSSLFDEVKNRSNLLGNKIDLISRTSFDNTQFNQMQEHGRKIAKERANELAMIKNISDLSLQSAKLLKELADAASSFLIKMEENRSEDNKATNSQLRIAVGSLIISVILSGAALCVSYLSYKQDKQNARAESQSQKQFISSIDKISDDNKILQEDISKLRNEISISQKLLNQKEKNIEKHEK